MPGLGRLHAPDPRDFRFLLSETPRADAVVRRANHLWAYFDKPFDQGNTGTCVGHGWKSFLVSAPVIQSDVDEPPSPFEIYDGCLPIDEWSDNDQDVERQFGTSVRAGAKYLASLGMVGEYRWCFSANQASDWLAGMDAEGRFTGGPLVIGVNWYDSMFETDTEGFLHIRPGSWVAGGHCVCLLGWNEKRGFAYGINSWGSNWGRSGRFYMPGEVLGRLLAESGEACSAIELRQRVG